MSNSLYESIIAGQGVKAARIRHAMAGGVGRHPVLTNNQRTVIDPDSLRTADVVVAHRFTPDFSADVDLLSIISDARAAWLYAERDVVELKVLIDDISGQAWEYVTLRRPGLLRVRRRVAEVLQTGVPQCHSELLIAGPKPPPLSQCYFLK